MTDRVDLPKLIATIMWTAPGPTIKGGFAYLRMKRMAKRSSRRFMDGLLKGGMPPEMARDLSEKYTSSLSIRDMIGGLDIP